MAFSHGKNAHFSLGTVGSETTVTDISDKLDEVNFPQSVETGDTTTFGSSARSYVVGLKDHSFSAQGKWDATVDEHLSALLGHETPADFEYGPIGSGTGDVQFTGSCYVTNYEVTTSVGDVISFTVEFQITGDTTRGTFT